MCTLSDYMNTVTALTAHSRHGSVNLPHRTNSDVTNINSIVFEPKHELTAGKQPTLHF